jgi:hypothetical protein
MRFDPFVPTAIQKAVEHRESNCPVAEHGARRAGNVSGLA